MTEQVAAPAVGNTQASNLMDITWDNLEETAPKMEVKQPEKEVDQKPADDKPDVVNEEKPEEKPEVKEDSANKKVEKPEEKKPSEELKDDLSIEVKVDGKMEKVSLKDLKANYSGKVAWDKKFTEIDKERKSVIKERNELKSEVDGINRYVNEFATKMKAKDSLGAMEYLSQFAGMSPGQMRKNMIDQLLPEINRLAGLTPEARELEFNKMDTEYNHKRHLDDIEKTKNEKARLELELEVTKIKSSNGVSDEEWEAAFEFLDTHLEKDKAITPKDVVQYAKWSKADGLSTSLLNEFDGGKHLEVKEVRDTLTDIIIKNPSFTKQDLLDILNDSLKGKVEEKVKEVVKSKSADKPRDEKGRFTYSEKSLDSWD